VKKILFFAKFFFFPPLGGGEYFIATVLKYLSQYYDCFAACYTNPSDQKPFQQNKMVYWQDIPVYQLIMKSKDNISSFFKAHEPDLVITQSFDAPEIVDCAKEMGIKTILGTHFWRNICRVSGDGDFNHMLTRPLDTLYLLKEKHRVFFEADEVYVNSDFMKEAVKRLVGKDVEHIIYPIVDLERIKAKDRDPTHITMINPDFGKGGDIFLNLAKMMPDKKFLCVGQAPNFTPVNRAINVELGNMKNVEVVDNTDDMASIYAKTKILLVPSKVDETFCMVALEAMVNGIPVLHSPRGNLPFLVENGGISIGEKDIAKWKENLKVIIEDKEAYKEFSNNAKLISEKYGLDKELSKFRKLVENCIGE
jgi:glycosyltransferase involved in cell wall biosynthesis